jgi:hypothetical protein
VQGNGREVLNCNSLALQGTGETYGNLIIACGQTGDLSWKLQNKEVWL